MGYPKYLLMGYLRTRLPPRCPAKILRISIFRRMGHAKRRRPKFPAASASWSRYFLRFLVTLLPRESQLLVIVRLGGKEFLAMGKQQSPPRKSSIGKGKVTPVQIAFIVNRYLAENNFSTTLSAFQSEAADFFAKTKSKEAPKGLLSLGDILDEYVTLKEQKIIVEQEKQRVEGVMRGINAAMESYHSAASGVFSPPSPPQPSLPPTPIPPPTPLGNSSWALLDFHIVFKTAIGHFFSYQISTGPMMQSTTLSRSIMQPRQSQNSSSHPSTVGKRKSSKTSVGVLAPSKKHCVESPSVESATRIANNLSDKCGALFDSKSSQAEKMNSIVHVSQTLISNADGPRQLTPSKCSVISSKTIIVSPYKGQGYIAVGKSVCISSPMKSSPQKTCRRDRVKGRLDFDDTGALISSTDPTAAEICGDCSENGMKDLLDLDIADFDLDFNFADLLVNIDLDSEELIT